MRDEWLQITLILTLGSLTVPVKAQLSASHEAKEKAKPARVDESAKTQIPERILDFSRVEPGPSVALSPVTSLPQCDPTGSIFLDMLDTSDLRKHTLVSINTRQTQTYSLSGISDLHDITMFGFFASESLVGFLVRGTKEPQTSPSPGVSPAGFAWSSYHTYIAEFDHNDTYKGSKELDLPFQVTRFAILPSGDFIVAGFDRLNSTLRLLLLDSSGAIIKPLDMPSFRKSPDKDVPYGSIEAEQASRAVIGPVVFSSLGQDVAAWSRNSNAPILIIGEGGRVRELQIEAPSGYTFVDLVASNDRLIAHFRLKSAPEDSPFTTKTYAYYELHPQDGSIQSRLSMSGDVPQFLACERDGHFITYKADKDNKLVLFASN